MEKEKKEENKQLLTKVGKSEISKEEKIVGAEEKKEEKIESKEEKKKVEIKKKEKAFVRGKDLSISTKHSIAICKFIRGKKIEKVIPELEKIASMKKALPMKGEIPHRRELRGKPGRYPINACKIFIQLLKSLNANCQVNGLNESYIFIAKADRASRPHRRFGGRFKRTNVYLEARELKGNMPEKKIEKKREVKDKNEETI